MTDLHLPNGTLSESADPVHLTPDQAGWNHTGLRVLNYRHW